jgi:creatinine amidohydrolase
MEIEWSRLKAREITALGKQDAIAFVPIGATEQHGPHLPVMTDSRLATEVSHRAARIVQKREPVVVTPSIWCGMSEHHMSLGGTITLDFATMNAVVRCVVKSLVRHGFRRIFVLNGHGGNTMALEPIVAELTIELKIPLAYSTYWNVAEKVFATILEKQKNVLHACEAETSMMLAVVPELIDRDELSQMHGPYITGLSAIQGANPGAYRWRQIGTRSGNGVIGDAATATPEKGERLLDAAAQALADTVLHKEFWTAPI